MEGNGTSRAILALVAATFALDVFSTFTSSPQTTEINAKARAGTLMKWVAIAFAVAVAGGAYGAWTSRKWTPLLAAGAVALGMYGLYVHARNRGLASDEAGTESY